MLVRKRNLLVFVFLANGSRAHAFIDPYTLVAGINAVSGVIGTVKGIDEAADIGISVGELLGELEIEGQDDSDLKEKVKRLEELSSKIQALELGAATGSAVLQDAVHQSKSVSQKLRSIRDMFGLTKKIAGFLGLRPKAGERALKVQDTKLNYMILDELIAIRKIEISRDLESKEQKAKLHLALENVLEEEGKLTRKSLRGLR